MKSVLNLVYNFIDRLIDTDADWLHYAAYWLGTVILIVATANLMSAVVFELVIRMPGTSSSGSSRHHEASQAARRLFPGSNTPRSDLAQGKPPVGEGSQDNKIAFRYVQQLQAETPVRHIGSMARRVYLQDRLLEGNRKFFRLFGGSFRFVPRLATAFTPMVVLLAVIAVLWVRPLPHQGQSLRSAFATIWRNLKEVTPTRLLPFILLAVGFLIIVLPSGLLDRIRARDEAVKDANRLSAEVCGQLTQLRYAAYEWRKLLEDCRGRLIREWVAEVSNWEYSWAYSGGIARSEEWPLLSHRQSMLNDEVGQRLEKIIDDLATRQQTILDKGLAVVALGLTWKVSSSVGELHIISTIAGDDKWLRGKFYPPSTIRRFQSDQERGLKGAFNALSHGSKERAFLERQLEDAAFNYVRWLDFILTQLMVTERHVARVASYLNRRMLGSLLTKSLSLVHK